MTRARLFGAVLLTLLVVVTATGVVYAKYQSRKLFAERESLRVARDELVVEWRQIQLELATFAAHGHVEALARRELKMHVPVWGEIRIVEP
jgi:cell division protein FtsL